MTRTMITAAAILLAATTVASAGSLRDYSDRANTCDKDEIAEELADMIQNSGHGIQYGTRLIYVKGDPVEISRKPNELRCRIDIKVTNSAYPTTGIFVFKTEDGRNLVGWLPGKRK